MPTMTFDEEFNTLDLTRWDTTFRFRDPNGNGGSLPSNNEAEWYINANYGPTAAVDPWTVAGGVLTLTAAPVDPSIRQYLGYTPQEQAATPGLPGMGSYDYTSGLLVSHFNQPYGYFEMSAKLPPGQGLWPAFWLLPQDGGWPPEIDIMEVLGDRMNQLWTTVHTTVNNDQNHPYADTDVGVDMSQGFHTYAVDWQASGITFYFDGNPVLSTPTPSDLVNRPMYMLVNLAVGGQGSWPGPLGSASELPAQMQVDYIRVWDTNPHVGGGGGQTISGSDSVTPANTLTGGGGDDVLIASHRPDILTGGAGADTFVYNGSPWQPGQITDFAAGVDHIDLRGLFQQDGVTYQAGDPILGHYVLLDQSGANTIITFEPDGTPGVAPWGSTVTTVQNATVAQVQAQLLLPGSSGSGGETWTDTGGTPISHTGTSGNDTLTPGQWGDTLTGGAGADMIVFQATPWNHDTVTDFAPGQDVLDLRPLFRAIGYSGSDPVGDGHLAIANDGAGDTTVSFDADGPGGDWPSTVVILNGVAASSLVAGRDWLFQ